MDRRQKRTYRNSPEEERPQPSRARRDSSPSTTRSIDRLTEIMADFIKATDSRSNTVVSKGEVVPAFNPDDREHNSISWCNKVDELREVFNWSEEATIYFALSKLRGLAETWYKGLPTIKFSWEQWKEKIQLAFPSQRGYHEMLGDMMRRRKRPEESFSKYFYEKTALLTQCKIFGLDAVSCIVGGIDDVIVKTGAKSGDYQTPEALYRYLNSLNDTPKDPSRPSNPKSHFKAAPRNKFSNKQRRTDPLKCFNCGRLGHKSNECYRPKRCSICRNPDHMEKDCRLKKAVPSSSTVA